MRIMVESTASRASLATHVNQPDFSFVMRHMTQTCVPSLSFFLVFSQNYWSSGVLQVIFIFFSDSNTILSSSSSRNVECSCVIKCHDKLLRRFHSIIAVKLHVEDDFEVTRVSSNLLTVPNMLLPSLVHMLSVQSFVLDLFQ